MLFRYCLGSYLSGFGLVTLLMSFSSGSTKSCFGGHVVVFGRWLLPSGTLYCTSTFDSSLGNLVMLGSLMLNLQVNYSIFRVLIKGDISH